MAVRNRIAPKHNPYALGSLGVQWTIGAETGGNTKAVSLRLMSAPGRVGVRMYFSDDANGDSVIATAPSGAVAIGTDGTLHDIGAAKKQFFLTTEENGEADFTIIEAAAKTLFAVIVNPDGTLSVSPAITFA